ncbi:MAG TPA: hypothetical protein VHX88_12000 [Solirubrobacteraceae bacterium]|jgi:hypothetical protein|nr:hypothetical protein [Solirubrobacteraceae bacterium]
MRSLAPLTAALLAAPAPAAHTAQASHAGWPPITGMLLMNKDNQSRPLDGRPGHDPFDGADPSYSCNGQQQGTACGGGTDFVPLAQLGAKAAAVDLVPADIGHNELLGGNGDNVIHAGPVGDVMWGDFHPTGQPVTQINHLYGGPGNDWIYSGHGTNDIWTGAGEDHVMLVYGHGAVHRNGPGHKTLVMRALARNRHYRLVGCSDVSILGFEA